MPVSIQDNYERAIDRVLMEREILSLEDKQSFFTSLKAIDRYGGEPTTDSDPATAKFVADCYQMMKHMEFPLTERSMRRFIAFRILRAQGHDFRHTGNDFQEEET